MSTYSSRTSGSYYNTIKDDISPECGTYKVYYTPTCELLEKYSQAVGDCHKISNKCYNLECTDTKQKYNYEVTISNNPKLVNTEQSPVCAYETDVYELKKKDRPCEKYFGLVNTPLCNVPISNRCHGIYDYKSPSCSTKSCTCQTCETEMMTPTCSECSQTNFCKKRSKICQTCYYSSPERKESCTQCECDHDNTGQINSSVSSLCQKYSCTSPQLHSNYCQTCPKSKESCTQYECDHHETDETHQSTCDSCQQCSCTSSRPHSAPPSHHCQQYSYTTSRSCCTSCGDQPYVPNQCPYACGTSSTPCQTVVYSPVKQSNCRSCKISVNILTPDYFVRLFHNCPDTVRKWVLFYLCIFLVAYLLLWL